MIGVLDIQGSVTEHCEALKKAGARFVRVKTLEDLALVKGLIIPGGESTTIGKLLNWYGLGNIISERVKDKSLALWGTCAGAILMAKKIVGSQKAENLAVMDISVERNAYGRQMDSFECELDFDFDELKKEQKNKTDSDNLWPNAVEIHPKIPAVFIRAPRISSIGGKVKILAKYKNEIVAVREGNMMASTFHPEMTDDIRVHQYFVELCGMSV